MGASHAGETRAGGRLAWGDALLCLAVAVLLVGSLVMAGVQASTGVSPHVANADCTVCHTAPAAGLNAKGANPALMLRPNLDAICMSCHADEGASHQTGILAKKKPPGLPLSPDGRIQCYTCHVMHGENPHFSDYTRIDNRRGALCLSCHTLSELSQ